MADPIIQKPEAPYRHNAQVLQPHDKAGKTITWLSGKGHDFVLLQPDYNVFQPGKIDGSTLTVPFGRQDGNVFKEIGQYQFGKDTEEVMLGNTIYKQDPKTGWAQNEANGADIKLATLVHDLERLSDHNKSLYKELISYRKAHQTGFMIDEKPVRERGEKKRFEVNKDYMKNRIDFTEKRLRNEEERSNALLKDIAEQLESRKQKLRP